MRRIWGLAAGPRIWLWLLAGQLGPYNLGSHSSLWPGEKTHTHIHQRQQQQQDPTSTTWTTHGNKVGWELQIMQQSEEVRKSQWRTNKPAHAHALIKSTHVRCCSWQQLKLLTFRSSACVRERRAGAKAAGEREESACMNSMLTLHFSLIRHLKQKGHWLWDESRAVQGRALSGDSCLHADNHWQAFIANVQQHCQHTAKQHSWMLFHQDDPNSAMRDSFHIELVQYVVSLAYKEYHIWVCFHTNTCHFWF